MTTSKNSLIDYIIHYNGHPFEAPANINAELLPRYKDIVVNTEQQLGQTPNTAKKGGFVQFFDGFFTRKISWDAPKSLKLKELLDLI